MKAILLTFALAALCVGRGVAQDATQSAVTLAERIADSGYGAKVTVAALPPGWTSPVPTPSMATLLGSVLNPSTGLVTLYYQAPDLRATYDAYIAALIQNGFTAQRFEAPARGFAPPESAGVPVSRTFCKGSYSLYVLAPAGRPDDFRLSVWPPQGNMTQMCGSARSAPPQRVNPLPLFAPPPGAQFVPIINAFSAEVLSRVPEVAVSAATITGAPALSETFRSLQTQLVAAGWQAGNPIFQADAVSADVAFGSGADAWRGLLVIFPGVKPNTLVAQISASGGSLTAPQAEAVQTAHMPLLAQPLRKSQEPALVRLMRRLFSEYAAGMPQTIYIGRAPPGIAKSVPLPERAPLGSTAVRGLQEPMVVNPGDTLYYTLSEKELRAYYSRLKARGWWPLALPENKGSGFYGPQEGGIVSFCKNGAPAVMVQVRPESGTNDINVNVSQGCGSMQQEIAQFASQFGPMPPITPPRGVTMSPGVPGIPAGISGAKFTGASSLSELLDSFSSQFVGAGWKTGNASVTAQVGSRIFTTTGPRGRNWQAVITVYASSSEAKTYYSFIDLTQVP